MLLQGTVINGAIVLDDCDRLPEGARVEVDLKVPQTSEVQDQRGLPKAASPLGEALMLLAGTAVGLPSDMAAQHDHYLHGTPKR